MRHGAREAAQVAGLSDEALPLPRQMRAIVYEGPGGPDVLHEARLALPTTAGSEFLVRVIAAGVNPIDAKTRAGRGYTGALKGYPATLGAEFSGVVMSSPYEAHPLKPGDEVYGMQGFPRLGGSYAEYIAVPELHIAKKPASLTHVEAAAVPLAALTAWGAVVETARVHQGQRMLIHAGAGGVGHFAIQLAHYFGAHVIATGSESNLPWLRELGADEVVDYTTARFENVVDEVDAVIDLIGNVHDQTGSRSLSVLRPGGIIVNVPTGSWPTFVEEAAEKEIRATSYKVAPSGATLSVLSRLLTSEDLKVHVSQVLPLAEAAEAHRLIEAGHTRGKIVLQVSEH